MKSWLKVLRSSPFFESFAPEHLQRLSEKAKLETFPAGTALLREGEPANRLYLLIDGTVELVFNAEDGASTTGASPRQVRVRSISEPGRVIGWSVMVEPYHSRAGAIARDDVQALAFEREWLEEYAEQRPDFGLELMMKILWVLGNRLRETRMRLVARRYDEEVVAIRALLNQSGPQLNVTSPLWKIPFYLENRLTLSDAFQALELLRAHGDEIERNLAGLCLDILENMRKEMGIYRQLQRIYEHVTTTSETVSPVEVRGKCCEDFIKLYEFTNFIVKGEENLPDGPGHIFIMNHLETHPQYILLQDFRLTLDTHFVSAVILYRQYGEAPIRVVRKSRADEYGHQRYYDRLGYIYVYAGHVDEDVRNPKLLAEQRRRLFLETAKSYLLDKKNIVLCPEGTSTATEASPVRFQSGAFRLASYVKPEPLLVPVAVANFDKKITRTTLAAVIKKPFKLSEFVPEPADDGALFSFIDGFQNQFRGYVREAIELAESRL